MNDVNERLIKWYNNHKRDLPWRRTRDPYFIWISEIIFQQTRIDQGLSYYKRFVNKYPTVHELASADEQDVLKSWQGLGYYSRARNMHYSAKYIVNELNGVFPDRYDEILKLKGVGPYTAAAIASISFNLPHPVIDGNVQRLMSRIFSIQEAVNTSLGMKMIANHLQLIFSPENPGDFNQAMMEFGARICKPQNPKCDECVLIESCQAYREGLVHKLPLKVKNNKPKDLFLYYYVISFMKNGNKHLYFRKRDHKGIWRGLYDFPSLESNHELSKHSIIKHPAILDLLGDVKAEIVDISAYQKHQLTHKNIKACFILLNLTQALKSSPSKALYLTEASKIDELPVSKLVANFLESDIKLNF